MKTLYLTSLLLIGCAHGGYRPPTRAGDVGAKLVTDIIETPHVDWWRTSKWYRPIEDLTIPARVYFSWNYACVMGFPPLREPRVSEYYVCPSGWRLPQG